MPKPPISAVYENEQRPTVVVFDYGFGNVRSAVRALEHVGAEVTLTSDVTQSLAADGLVVPGVGAFAACLAGLRAAGGDQVICERLEANKPVLGICVGMQIMFTDGLEHGVHTDGLDYWGGRVERLAAPIVPHMGWSEVSAPAESSLFAGIADQRFYFVHSYAATQVSVSRVPNGGNPQTTWSDAGAAHAAPVPFIAAVEDGPLAAVQFHPEKSGQAGLALLRNWLLNL